MIKRLFLILVLSGAAFAQQTRLADTHTFTTSGEIWDTSNSNGSINASFEEKFNGAPATVSIVIAGCKVGRTCDTLETYTTVANSVRSPTISKVYDYFEITASWTGGTAPTVVVNTTITTAVNGLGGGGGSGTVTSIATTSPITGGTITGTGTIACATCTITVGSGTVTVTGDAPTTGACASEHTASVTGLLTTDVVHVGFNGDPSAVTGIAPTTSGGVYILAYPKSAGTLGLKVCNDTTSTITVGTLVLNYWVAR